MRNRNRLILARYYDNQRGFQLNKSALVTCNVYSQRDCPFKASKYKSVPVITLPSFYLSYEAMGVRNYSYLARNLEGDL